MPERIFGKECSPELRFVLLRLGVGYPGRCAPEDARASLHELDISADASVGIFAGADGHGLSNAARGMRIVLWMRRQGNSRAFKARRTVVSETASNTAARLTET